MATIAERIALLKLNQPGASPPSLPPSDTHSVRNNARSRPPPPPPPLPNRRPGVQQAQSDSQVEVIGSAASHARANLPDGALPVQTTPSPPTRRPTCGAGAMVEGRAPSTLLRQDSRESIASIASGKSAYSIASARTATSSLTNGTGSLYTVRAPSFETSKLPPLPPKRSKEEVPKLPARPPIALSDKGPSLPRRSQASISDVPETINGGGTLGQPPLRRSALTQGFGEGGTDIQARSYLDRQYPSQPPSLPTRPGSRPAVETGPSPIPSHSRPDLKQLKLSKPKPASVPTEAAVAVPNPPPPVDTSACLICRDFSGPDAHAARFPRHSLPTQDLDWLAQSLTQPFPSTTDKARAIFSWLHHNIIYDTASFFAGTVKPSTPAATLQTGLAVCAGYAGLFATLCIKAGLQAQVINGHGKGFGHVDLGASEPCPPASMNHAWNAVLLDDGALGWKLLDSCWGSGYLDGSGTYRAKFTPLHFTMTNERFGLRHFPDDKRSFYRADGGCPTWEQYMRGGISVGSGSGSGSGGMSMGEGPKLCGGVCEEEGLDGATLRPAAKDISLSRLGSQQPSLRFSLAKLCPHWDPERNGRGKYYCYWVIVEPPPLNASSNDDRFFHVLDTNGWTWWVDVPVEKLGVVGGRVRLAAVTDAKGKSARGVTPGEMRGMLASRSLGSCSWRNVATWDLVV